MGRRWHQTSRRIYIFYGKGNDNHELGKGFSYIRESKRIISAVKRVEFVSGRMSYITRVQRGHWCDITLLILHVQKTAQ
jgi:hypothetical protein